MHNEQEKKIIEEFFYRNRENIENPIIKSFLKNRENYQLVLDTLLEPTKMNMDIVDRSFHNHYKKVKKIKYISNLIHFFSIGYDKRKRRDDQRYFLVLDKPLPKDSMTSPKDLIIAEQSPSITLGNNLLDHIEDEHLTKALKKLSQRQIKILEMLYLESRPLKEVAEILQLSPQNTSNHHRRALKKIYKYYTGVEGDD